MSNSLLSVFPVLALLMFSNITFENPEVEILGRWTYKSANKEIKTYTKHSSSGNKKPAITFLENGKLVKKQNAGWCGTPPVTYRNFEGTWEWKDENTIAMTYDFWGGQIDEVWEIISSTEDELQIKSISFETRHYRE